MSSTVENPSPHRLSLSVSSSDVRASSLLSSTLVRDGQLRVETVKGKNVFMKEQVYRAKLMWELGTTKFKRNLTLILVSTKSSKNAKDIVLELDDMRAITPCDKFRSESSAAFTMHMKKKVYHCVGENEDDMLGWVASIQAAVEEGRVQEGPPLLYHVSVIDSPSSTAHGERLMEFHPRWQPHCLVFRSPLSQVVVYSADIQSMANFGYSSRTGHLWMRLRNQQQTVLHINGVTAAHVARVLRIHVEAASGELEVNDQLLSADRINYNVPGLSSSSKASFDMPSIVQEDTNDSCDYAEAGAPTRDFESKKDGGKGYRASTLSSSEGNCYESMVSPKEVDDTLDSNLDEVYEMMEEAYVACTLNANDTYDNAQAVAASQCTSAAEYDHLANLHTRSTARAPVQVRNSADRRRSFSSSPPRREEYRYDRLFGHLDESGHLRGGRVRKSEEPVGAEACKATTTSVVLSSPFQRVGGFRFTTAARMSSSRSASSRTNSGGISLSVSDQDSISEDDVPIIQAPPLPAEEDDIEYENTSAERQPGDDGTAQSIDSVFNRTSHISSHASDPYEIADPHIKPTFHSRDAYDTTQSIDSAFHRANHLSSRANDPYEIADPHIKPTSHSKDPYEHAFDEPPRKVYSHSNGMTSSAVEKDNSGQQADDDEVIYDAAFEILPEQHKKQPAVKIPQVRRNLHRKSISDSTVLLRRQSQQDVLQEMDKSPPVTQPKPPLPPSPIPAERGRPLEVIAKSLHPQLSPGLLSEIREQSPHMRAGRRHSAQPESEQVKVRVQFANTLSNRASNPEMDSIDLMRVGSNLDTHVNGRLGPSSLADNQDVCDNGTFSDDDYMNIPNVIRSKSPATISKEQLANAMERGPFEWSPTPTPDNLDDSHPPAHAHRTVSESKRGLSISPPVPKPRARGRVPASLSATTPLPPSRNVEKPRSYQSLPPPANQPSKQHSQSSDIIPAVAKRPLKPPRSARPAVKPMSGHIIANKSSYGDESASSGQSVSAKAHFLEARLTAVFQGPSSRGPSPNPPPPPPK